jgi:hypothetical protein
MHMMHGAWWSHPALRLRFMLSYLILTLSALVLAWLQDGRSLGYFRPLLFTVRLARNLLEFKQGEVTISVVLSSMLSANEDRNWKQGDQPSLIDGNRLTTPLFQIP